MIKPIELVETLLGERMPQNFDFGGRTKSRAAFNVPAKVSASGQSIPLSGPVKIFIAQEGGLLTPPKSVPHSYPLDEYEPSCSGMTLFANRKLGYDQISHAAHLFAKGEIEREMLMDIEL